MAPLSAGQLLDQISALECELQHGVNGIEPAEPRRKLLELGGIYAKRIVETGELRQLRADLKSINQALRESEADMGRCERENDFGPRFVSLFKSIRQLTERRAAIRQEIDQLVNSSGIKNELAA